MTPHARQRAVQVRQGGFRGDAWLIRRLMAGWAPQAVAVAAGVSLRTARRWRAEVVDVVTLELDGHEASFALRRDRPPMQLSSWRRKRA